MSVVRRIAVGQNHRSAEVLNQPTDDILTLSGCTLGATFPGFAVNGAVPLKAVRTLTASGAVTSTDATVRLDCSSGAITATLPAAASVSGQTFALLKVDTGGRIGTVACTGAETISGYATVTLEEQGAGLRVQSNGTSYDVLP